MKPSSSICGVLVTALLFWSSSGIHITDSESEGGDDKVDVVYTWVEEPKPESKTYKEIEKLCGMKEKGSGNGIQRYRDCGTFQYSLLSVQKFLPWVNKIWLVSEGGSMPPWMAAFDGEFRKKIKGVSHKDIWPKDRQDKELPTHHSNAIETHIHRIDDLAERFIYFNNDMFIGHMTNKSDFFNDKGKVVYYDRLGIDVDKMDLDEMQGRDGAMKFGNFHMMHQATPFLKSGMAKLQEDYDEDFKNVSAQRCRPDDALKFMPFWFLNWYQVKKGMAEVRPWKKDLPKFAAILKGEMESGNESFILEKNWYIKQLELRPKRFCIEDDFSYDEKVFKTQKNLLHTFMATYFGMMLEKNGESNLETKSWKDLKKKLGDDDKHKFDGDGKPSKEEKDPTNNEHVEKMHGNGKPSKELKESAEGDV